MEFAIQQLLLFVCLGPFAVQSTDLYSITVKDLQGNVVPMSIFQGKVGIICLNGRCVTHISQVVLRLRRTVSLLLLLSSQRNTYY